MKVFVLCEAYPSESDKYAMSFLHPRVVEYLKIGYDVEVISFSCNKDYIFENVKVLTESSGVAAIKSTERPIIISHAPNLKNHFRFLFKYKKYYNKLIFFFHGHEILKTKNYYPKPYAYCKSQNKERSCLLLYDFIKLPLVRLMLKYFSKHVNAKFVFVSDWMKKAAFDSMKVEFDERKCFVINNPISRHFLENEYLSEDDKYADFITIRPLDVSKYSVDMVVEFAKSNPQFTFHIYGRGNYFKYNEKPINITVINDFILQKDIPTLLNKYKYSIMPTRLDAQGVMMCEIASYGMPIIVSDIDVCHEMLDGFSNVMFLKNDNFNLPIQKLPMQNKNNYRFSYNNTVKKEIELLISFKIK